MTGNIKEIFKNLTDELFGPLKVPKLMEIGRSDIQLYIVEGNFGLVQGTGAKSGWAVGT